MKFKNYLDKTVLNLTEGKKIEIFYRGNNIEVEYDIKKHHQNIFRITIPNNKDSFGQIIKNKSKWEAEVKKKDTGDTWRFAGIWNNKKSAIEEVVSILMDEPSLW